MTNKTPNPQTQSLLDFWTAQQARLSLLAGVPVTDDVVKLTAAFGESDIRAFEKLMQAQNHLADLLAQTSEASVTPTAVPASRRIPNPVIDKLDLADPRTVRRFEIHSYEQSDVPRGESMILPSVF